jgi:DNA-binding NarL/FixJ family response regulator
MAQKKELALRLLSQGLTVKQIAAQLRCAPAFVRRVRNEEAQRLDAENVA